MEFFPNFRTIVKIGNFYLGWYPVLLTLGTVCVFELAKRNMIKDGYKEDMCDDLFIGGTICGVIGARLWYVVFYDLKMYLSDPISIFKTWEGGLAIQGTIVGAALFVLYYCKKHHYSFFRVCDCIFPVILIGQAIGRWGNFFNQEAYGRVVDPAFYNGWPKFIAEHMYISGAYREPTFLYESVLNILGFVIINFIYKRKVQYRRGDLIYAYLMWYGVTRTFVEYFRSDSLMIGKLKMAQVTCIFFLIVGVLGMFGLFRRILKEKPVILFDFDQTLANSEPIISETFRQLFEKYLPEHPFGEAEIRKVIGPTLKESFEYYQFPKDTEELIAEYREINRSLHTPEHLKAMPNAKELLLELKKRGYKVGIVSNKMKATVEFGADIIGIRETIDCVVGMDNVTKTKPDPEGIFTATVELGGNHDCCIYVGDVKGDIITGRNAMAYTFGYNVDPKEAETLWEAQPNEVITDLIQILESLEGDHEWTINLT